MEYSREPLVEHAPELLRIALSVIELHQYRCDMGWDDAALALESLAEQASEVCEKVGGKSEAPLPMELIDTLNNAIMMSIANVEAVERAIEQLRVRAAKLLGVSEKIVMLADARKATPRPPQGD